MTLTRAIVLFLLALFVFATPQPSGADPIPDPLRKPNIRITDPWLRRLIEAGISQSPTFRSLVERLDGSDVVVYIHMDPLPSADIAGRMTFQSSVGGLRYLVIRLAPLRSVVQQLAMIGHELQHAVEVADNAGIVDADTLYREYLRIGYINGTTVSGISVDTRAAMDTGARVADELREVPLVFPAPLLP